MIASERRQATDLLVGDENWDLYHNEAGYKYTIDILAALLPHIRDLLAREARGALKQRQIATHALARPVYGKPRPTYDRDRDENYVEEGRTFEERQNFGRVLP